MSNKAPSRDYREGLLKRLAESPEYAQEYLNAALEDEDDPRVFLLALRDVADAYGGVGKLAKAAELSRESLYRALSKKGNPQFDTIDKCLDALGFQITITAKAA